MSTGPILLILGGTREARALAHGVADAGFEAIYSYAGRTAAPVTLPIPTRIGGFGGVEGLTEYLAQARITHVIDATHPFAATMSRNAVAACRRANVPLIALTRPPWVAEDGDTWVSVPDMAGAVAALDGAPLRIFLAIGKMEVARFAARPQHHYLLRLVDRPRTPPPLPNHDILVAKGPFDVTGDRALLRQHRIDLIVSKNAGGQGARAKIDAARALGLPVLMIGRPDLPKRREVQTIEEVLDWVAHSGAQRGV